MRRQVFGVDLRHRFEALVWAAAVSAGLVHSAGAAPRPPDLTGIWTWYLEPGSAPFAPPVAGNTLPLTEEGKRKVSAYQALVAPTSDNPGAHCLGSGMPDSMILSGGYPMEIIQRPEQITIVYEAHSETRRLYFAAKVIPEPDRLPARNGYSVSHWEGAVLVVETSSLKEQADEFYPHSDQARIVEKYRLTTTAKRQKILVADMTLTDPVFYTKPVTAQKKWVFDPKGILLPYECDEEGWLNHLDELRKAAHGVPDV
jgi:hypothetical protein